VLLRYLNIDNQIRMFRFKKILILISVFLYSFTANAQRNEIGLLLGTSYYLGDLNPSKHFFLTKPAGGIIYRYIITPRWAVKMDGLYGRVAGDDAKSKVNVNRNLSFRSSIFEASSQLELNFLTYATGNKDKNYFSPYIFAGLALFHFNPKAEYSGTWYALQPLGTEGQRTTLTNQKPYPLTGVSIPFGIGFKYSIGDNVCIGAEWGLRKTFTDYIDDISTTYPDPTILAAQNGEIAAALSDRSLTAQSQHAGLQRGNSITKDWYAFAGAFITFKFKAFKDETCPAYNKHITKYRNVLKKD
jgi:hypothetical protein